MRAIFLARTFSILLQGYSDRHSCSLILVRSGDEGVIFRYHYINIFLYLHQQAFQSFCQ